MVYPPGPSTLLQSGLRLFREAGSIALQGAAQLSAGDPDRMLDGLMDLRVATRSAGLASRVMRTAQEIDEALLDILA